MADKAPKATREAPKKPKTSHKITISLPIEMYNDFQKKMKTDYRKQTEIIRDLINQYNKKK